MIRSVYQDFDIFSRALFQSNDIDPDYLIIKEFGEMLDLNPFWFAFCYLNYYDIYSGIEMSRFFPKPEDWNEKDFTKVSLENKFNFCRERKGNARKIEVQVKGFQTFLNFYYSPEFQHSLKDADRMRTNIMKLYNQGAMIGYKYIEVLQKSFGFTALTPPDMNMKNYPSKIDSTLGAFGIKYLYGIEHDYDKEFIKHWEAVGANLAKAYGVDAGAVETCCCKFAKLSKGRYYLGYDIYEHFQLEELVGESEYKRIMSKHFDERWWKTPTIYKEHMDAYKRRKELVFCDDFISDYPEVNVLEIIMES